MIRIDFTSSPREFHRFFHFSYNIYAKWITINTISAFDGIRCARSNIQIVVPEFFRKIESGFIMVFI